MRVGGKAEVLINVLPKVLITARGRPLGLLAQAEYFWLQAILPQCLVCVWGVSGG